MLRIVELGWVVGCNLKEERWDEKEEEKTEEESVGRWGGYVMVFSDEITDEMNPSVILSVTVPRHCTAISV